jgi:hypothetical protein
MAPQAFPEASKDLSHKNDEDVSPNPNAATGFNDDDADSSDSRLATHAGSVPSNWFPETVRLLLPERAQRSNSKSLSVMVNSTNWMLT